jgi:hypothetical protein
VRDEYIRITEPGGTLAAGNLTLENTLSKPPRPERPSYHTETGLRHGQKLPVDTTAGFGRILTLKGKL